MSVTASHHFLPDGSRAWLHRWQGKGKPRACVQIVHGMAEHGGRYARLAAALNAQGIAVYAQDLPGHGRTAASHEDLGHFADSRGWAVALSAVNGVRGLIEREHPKTPLFLFGHSMGSFLAQYHLVEHGAGLAGVVLSATTGNLGPMRGIGERLMRIEARLLGLDHRSALGELLSFKAFNREFRPNRTAADWLSRDEQEVDAYIADPLCGFRCSAALWMQLLHAGAVLTEPKRLERIPKALPVLMIAGSEDPVCQGGKGAHLLAEHYRKSGMSDVIVNLFEGARHELLNETCRDEVTATLLEWLELRLPR